MLKCKSEKCNIYGICICEADAQQLNGGHVCCDIAEECDYNKEKILKRCEYAEPDNIRDAVTKELFS